MKKFFSKKEEYERLVDKKELKEDNLEEERQRAKEDLRELERVALERERVEQNLLKAAQEDKDRREAEEKQRNRNLMKF